MTKEELSKLRSIQKEIELIKKRKQLAIDKEAIEFAKKRSKDLGVAL